MVGTTTTLKSSYLGEERRLLSGSLRFLSKDRLLALLPGDRVREGDLLCLDLLSFTSGDRLLLDLSRCFGDRLLLLGLRPGLLLGDLFSFPEEASRTERRHRLVNAGPRFPERVVCKQNCCQSRRVGELQAPRGGFFGERKASLLGEYTPAIYIIVDFRWSSPFPAWL